MSTVECLVGPENTVGESPVWRPAESALYWVDIPARKVHRLHPESGVRSSWRTSEMVACIAFDRESGLIAGMESGIFSLRLGEGGQLEEERLAAPEFAMQPMRFNDGRCDRQGRFWAGTMHTDMAAGHAVGGLYRFTQRNALKGPVIANLLTQNGLAWSPCGSTMYLSDSHPKSQTIWAFDFDRDEGLPRNQRVFVDMNQHPGRPDGAAVDEDGCYWICANDGGQLLRFTPQGELDRSIALPVKKPAMCAFGGKNLDTLFITSIRPGNPADLVDQPLAGGLFAVMPGVKGLVETEFRFSAANAN